MIGLLLVGACVDTRMETDAPKRAYVAADYPAAARTAREIFAEGGSAADAAAGMALTMAATLPSRVGLGGGGVCVVFDAAAKTVRTLDFLPRAEAAGGAVVPTFLRAAVLMHATGGQLRWERVAVRAEALARANEAISPLLAADIAAAAPHLGDAAWRRRFAPEGRPLSAGQSLAQPELAATLSLVRREGFRALAVGPLAESFAAGLGVDRSVLAAAAPRWGETVAIRHKSAFALHLPRLPEGPSGAAVAQAWEASAELAPETRAAQLDQRLHHPGAAAPGAGFVVIDGDQNAFACAFTQGALFGEGRLAGSTGIAVARPVADAGFGLPALLANTLVGGTRFAAVSTAAGGEAAGAAARRLAQGTAAALLENQNAPALAGPPGSGIGGRLTLVSCTVSFESGRQSCLPASPVAGGALVR